MDKYVTTVTLEVNGQSVDDFKTFTEDARVLRRPVQLMNKTGVADVTPRYGFRIGYAVPKNKPEFDFESVEEGTVSVEYENGQRTTYTGVHCLEIGEARLDGESDLVKEIVFIAGDRVKE